MHMNKDFMRALRTEIARPPFHFLQASFPVADTFGPDAVSAALRNSLFIRDPPYLLISACVWTRLPHGAEHVGVFNSRG